MVGEADFGPPMTARETLHAHAATPRLVERWLVILIALHSYAVGGMLFLAPRWAASFGGWEGDPHPLFFLRQAGVFHFVLATAYLIEYTRYRGVAVLLSAKGFALVFLLLESVIFPVSWAVPFSGVADGLMGATILAAHLWVRKQQERER